jgi:hypothetical protein
MRADENSVNILLNVTKTVVDSVLLYLLEFTVVRFEIEYNGNIVHSIDFAKRLHSEIPKLSYVILFQLTLLLVPVVSTISVTCS